MTIKSSRREFLSVMLPREDRVQPHRPYSSVALRGRKIILWLAFGDLMATLGVLLRSVLKILVAYEYLQEEDTNIVLCVILAVIIQYFYTVTWMWTLIYAIDMWLALQDKKGYPVLYHSLVWIIPACLTSVGLFILYAPNVDCHNLLPNESAFLRILPNYFATYLPILTVMTVNPILYLLSARSVHIVVARSLCQYTQKERKIVDSIRLKFGLINLVFYVCWLPNIIGGIIVWVYWDNLPRTFILVLWYLMATTNPLQALFNSLVYRRSRDKVMLFRNHQQAFGETTPLLPASKQSGKTTSD
ncbi:G-protein coupled receptor 143 isoform X2 [Bemisia tabaci]|uniref:G-protein coupled receptor 143 isoform X2 n=1 Tax=Bemisia tabaci TaxID=7038 RepID=UPI003B27F302